MLTGQLPFKGEVEAAVAYAVVNTEPEPPTALRSGLPIEIDRVVDQALAKDPEERYQHIEGMLVDLRALQKGEASSVSRRRRRGRRRRSILVGAASAAVAVLLGAFGLDWFGGRPADEILQPEASVVVLPLDNLPGDPEQQYFSDGMTDALIADLGKIGALKVISRHSAMRYRDTDKPLPEIARELGVSHVVVGSVMQADGQVRITAQLVEAETDQQLWSDSFVRERRGILALQAQVAQTIAQQIKGRLDPEEQARLAKAEDVNPEAYEAYLQGRFHRGRLSPEALDTALQYFELALEKDPEFALAYVGVASVWGSRQQMGLTPPQEATPRAKAAAAKALELDGTLAEVHNSVAGQKTYMDWDWEAAGAAYRRAIEINPNYAHARSSYSHFLNIMRQPEEAMAQIERAMELDPHNPYFQAFYAADLLFVRQYDDAIAQARETRKLAADNPVLHTVLAESFHATGMYEEAFEEHRAWFAGKGDREVEQALIQGYQEGGYHRAMSLAAEAVAARSPATFVPSMQVAKFYVLAGRKEPALDWLENAYETHEPNLPYAAVAPAFDILRDEPRFQNLLRRMNLPL